MFNVPPATRGTSEKASSRLGAVLFCVAAVVLPFLAVTYPPITDLPQQVAQVFLLDEAFSEVNTGDGAELYRVNFWHPNKLGYLPLLVGRVAGGDAVAAGRAGMALIAMLWVLGVHGLARLFDRPPEAAIVATVFFFNTVTYWGFLNFMVGLPAFAVYLAVLHGERRAGERRGPRLLGAALLLYGAHVLWLALGLAYLAAVELREYRRGATAADVLRRVSWIVPVLVALAAWYAYFDTSGVDERTFWGHAPWLRLSASWLTSTLLGGLRGTVEPVLLVSVLAWCLLGAWQHRGELRRAVDARLALLGGLLLVAALTLPGVHRHTIFFAGRWAAPAAVFLVLALPVPRLRPRFRGAAASVLVLAMTVATLSAWLTFDRDEMAGMDEALNALPEEGRLLGLDMLRESPTIHGYPYYHQFAWGQVLRGGELNRTFADEASSLVSFRELPHRYPWTDRLDWRPRDFRVSDRDHFDHILVHGRPEDHAFFGRDPQLEAVSPLLPWRLYRVLPSAGP